MKHTLSVHVENKPGALARIAGMFARRAFNIESLAVGPTERPDISRVTLRVECEAGEREQIEKQMHKLVNVLRITELESRSLRVEGRLADAWVDELRRACERHRARTLDLHGLQTADVDGLKLPFRVRHAVNGDTTEETTFDRFRINARVDPRRFAVGG